MRFLRRQSLPVRLSDQLVVFDSRLTCVPPSPGRVLYHNDLWGPDTGVCEWSPWQAATLDNASKERAMDSISLSGYFAKMRYRGTPRVKKDPGSRKQLQRNDDDPKK